MDKTNSVHSHCLQLLSSLVCHSVKVQRRRGRRMSLSKWNRENTLVKITLLEMSRSVMDFGTKKNGDRGVGVVLCASQLGNSCWENTCMCVKCCLESEELIGCLENAEPIPYRIKQRRSWTLRDIEWSMNFQCLYRQHQTASPIPGLSIWYNFVWNT